MGGGGQGVGVGRELLFNGYSISISSIKRVLGLASGDGCTNVAKFVEYTLVPTYQPGICPAVWSGCMNLWIILNPIYYFFIHIPL